MRKLSAVGVKGNLFNWIKDWLHGRHQRVVMNGVSTSWKAVTSGVPQGSILGPILFIVFINDIDENISSTVLKFADDTKLLRGLSNDRDINNLQEDLMKLFQWSQDWQMLFNIEKCKVLHVGRKNLFGSY